jgi:hypothetical protein
MAGLLFPYERRFRLAYPLRVTNDVLQTNGSKERAIHALEQGLKVDPTDSSLLPYLITLDLETGRTKEAQAAFDVFKQVAKESPLVKRFKRE